MNRSLLTLTSASALVFSSACLQAQTDLGTQYFEVGPVLWSPDAEFDAGLGAVVKWNSPIAKQVDLYLRGTYVGFDDLGVEITELSGRLGVTAFMPSGGVRPYVGAEVGVIYAGVNYGGGWSDNETSLLLAGLAGLELPFGDKFSMALTARYDYYETAGSGDFFGGVQGRVKLSETFSLIAGLEVSDDQDKILSVLARFKY